MIVEPRIVDRFFLEAVYQDTSIVPAQPIVFGGDAADGIRAIPVVRREGIALALGVPLRPEPCVLMDYWLIVVDFVVQAGWAVDVTVPDLCMQRSRPGRLPAEERQNK